MSSILKLGTIEFIEICLVIAILAIAAIILIKSDKKTRLKVNKKEKNNFIIRFFKKRENIIKKYETKLTLENYQQLLLVCPVFLIMLFVIVLKNIPISLIFGIAGFFVPDAILNLQKSKTLKEFNRQYVKSLELLSSCLKSQMSISESVKECSKSPFLSKGIKKRYAIMYSDLSMGMGIKEAFENFADSCDSKDAKDVAIAITIQSTVGGKEADVIKNIADNIRTRMRTKEEVNSIFTSANTTIYAMDIIPILVVGGFLLTARSLTYIYLENPIFTLIFIVLAIIMFLGSVYNHRVLKKIEKKL